MNDEQNKPADAPVTPPAPAAEPTPVQTTPVPPAPQGPSGTNGLAIASMVIGIFVLITGWIPFWSVVVGILAIVFGVIALKKPTGKGMAIAGIVTGAIGALWGLIVSAILILALVAGVTASNSVNQTMNDQRSQREQLEDSKKDFARGETAVFADKYEVKVNESETSFDAGELYTPAEGEQYVRVNVTVKNISDEPEFFSNLTLQLNDGQEDRPSTLIPLQRPIESVELAPGEEVTGNVYFRAAADASDLKLVYSVTTFDQSYTSTRLTYTLAI